LAEAVRQLHTGHGRVGARVLQDRRDALAAVELERQ
jgi:hypothetical protein